MKTLGTLPPEEKIAAGKALNLLKSAVETPSKAAKANWKRLN